MSDSNTKKNILVVGYYDHYNLGDEQYKISIQYVLRHIICSQQQPPNQIDFIDCDKITHHTISNYQVIVLGGGDVLNTYFLNKLNTAIQDSTQHCPKIIALSVGIPYNSIFTNQENLNKLMIFDHIYLRSKQDIPIFSQYFDKNKITYLPDTSCFLLDAVKHQTPTTTNNQQYKTLYHTLHSISRTKKIININLCRHIYHRDPPYLQNYWNIIRELARFIDVLIKRGYYIVLLPFNTKPNASDDYFNHENDILIQKDVLQYVTGRTDHIINIDFDLSVPEILSLYSTFYVSIPMRFHGTLFSIHSCVPMIPIYTTKKIKNLLLDIGWTHEYVFEKNEKDLPVRFNANKMILIFDECVKKYMRNRLYLRQQYEMFQCLYKKQSNNVWIEMFSTNTNHAHDYKKMLRFVKIKERSVSSISSLDESIMCYDIVCMDKDNAIKVLESNSNKENNDNDDKLINDISQKMHGFAREHGYNDFREITDEELKSIVVSAVSYYLTGSMESRYNDGMMQKMFDSNRTYQYEKEWKWVLQHHKGSCRSLERLEDNPEGIFNIGYIDQNDQSGAHRSGWKYVYDNIKHLHNSKCDLMLDLYVDRTFHWKRLLYRLIGIVPYRRNWIGFVHHTFDTTFSKYNNAELLKCPDFLESLKCCRGIIVLSRYLQQQFIEAFANLGISVKVHYLKHPTELNVPRFSWEAFKANEDKKLINVGGWLRNIFSFYRLQLRGTYDVVEKKKVDRCLARFAKIFGKKVGEKVGNTSFGVRKVALKGRFMDNYYPTVDFVNRLSGALGGMEVMQSGGGDKKFCSGGNLVVNNNWSRHFVEYVGEMCGSVDIVDAVNNEEYDNLLCSNIVFLHLVDGSAVNTLIECYVRGTPVVVNRHPAAVEVLGSEYRWYYDSLEEVDGVVRKMILECGGCYGRRCGEEYGIEVFVEGLRGLCNYA